MDAVLLSNATAIQAATARALIRAMGMHAINQFRTSQGEPPIYNDDAFFALIDEEGISHNAVWTALSQY